MFAYYLEQCLAMLAAIFLKVHLIACGSGGGGSGSADNSNTGDSSVTFDKSFGELIFDVGNGAIQPAELHNTNKLSV